MGKEQQQKLDFHAPEPGRPPQPKGHGFDGLVRSKVKGGLHTKAELKRAGTPQGDRIGERSKGLS